MTRRGEAIERPRPWTVRAADRSGRGVDGWDKLVARFPEAADRAFVAVTSDPRRTDERQHRLKGALTLVSVAGKDLEQWQYEVLAAGRLFYAIDDEARALWVTAASIGHPKETDRPRRRKR